MLFCVYDFKLNCKSSAAGDFELSYLFINANAYAKTTFIKNF